MNDETREVDISLRSNYYSFNTFLENIAKPFVDLAVFTCTCFPSKELLLPDFVYIFVMQFTDDYKEYSILQHRSYIILKRNKKGSINISKKIDRKLRRIKEKSLEKYIEMNLKESNDESIGET